jgi:hypothetical protein
MHACGFHYFDMHRDRLILALGEQVAPGYAGVSGV